MRIKNKIFNQFMDTITCHQIFNFFKNFYLIFGTKQFNNNQTKPNKINFYYFNLFKKIKQYIYYIFMQKNIVNKKNLIYNCLLILITFSTIVQCK